MRFLSEDIFIKIVRFTLNMDLVGVIGPTKGYDREKVERVSRHLSKILINAGYAAIINPTVGSSPELFGQVFKSFPDSHLVGIIYNDPLIDGYELQIGAYDKPIYCETWEDQPRVLVQNARHLVALGISSGTNWEISLTKFYWRLGRPAPNQGGRVFMLTDLEKERYPDRLNESLKIEYVSIEELARELRGEI